jgi:hypothetical protein
VCRLNEREPLWSRVNFRIAPPGRWRDQSLQARLSLLIGINYITKIHPIRPRLTGMVVAGIETALFCTIVVQCGLRMPANRVPLPLLRFPGCRKLVWLAFARNNLQCHAFLCAFFHGDALASPLILLHRFRMVQVVLRVFKSQQYTLSGR